MNKSIYPFEHYKEARKLTDEISRLKKIRYGTSEK